MAIVVLNFWRFKLLDARRRLLNMADKGMQ